MHHTFFINPLYPKIVTAIDEKNEEFMESILQNGF